MAYYVNYGEDNDVEDMWTEERMPYFQEIILQSNYQPRDRNIYVMYHGTTAAAAVQIIDNGFKQSEDGMLGTGVYVSRSIEKAARYPLGNQSDQVILKLRVNVGKVIAINYQGHPLQKTWHNHGYDTAWVPASCGMVPSQLEEDCIWDPKRIKVVGIVNLPPYPITVLRDMLMQSEQIAMRILIRIIIRILLQL